MNQESRSLSYRWAKRALQHKVPKWMPLLYIFLAAICVVVPYFGPTRYLLAIVFFGGMFSDFRQRGFKEVYDEQQSVIAALELQQRKLDSANKVT